MWNALWLNLSIQIQLTRIVSVEYSPIHALRLLKNHKLINQMPTMQIDKVMKFFIAIGIGFASWLLIKSVIKIWLHPVLNFPADSDFGYLFAASISSLLAYRYFHGKDKDEASKD